jgi:hypothetical protein
MRANKNKRLKLFPRPVVYTRSNSGLALVMTLVIISMVALLVVGVMIVVRLESAAASNHFEKQRANAVAALGEAVALGKIRAALDPFQIGQYNGRFWSMEPGRIAIFDTSSPAAAPDFVNLISALPTADPLTEVDLNRQSFGGFHPIAQTGGPGGDPPQMPIGWTVVLENPQDPASQNNQMIGRYAFWVDDESSKVNINIANGTARDANGFIYNNTNNTNNVSSGPGQPSEVNLTALTGITTDKATNIVNYARSRGFHSAADLLEVPGITLDDYQTNKFSITHYSRVPELNIFGEPRINLIQTDLDPSLSGTARPLRNMASVQPQTALYPTSLQLTNVFPASSPAVDATQGLAQQLTLRRHGLGQKSVIERNFSLDAPESGVGSTDDTDYENNFWTLLRRITRYMEGRDSRGNSVSWPFTGINFTPKYNIYQRDSIGLQIVDLMKAGTSDLHWTNNGTSYIDRMRSAPTVIPQAGASNADLPPTSLVWGEGRSPKLTEVVMQIEANPATETLNTVTYNIAKVKLAIWIESYLPRYANGDTNDDPYTSNADTENRWRYLFPFASMGSGYLNVNDIPEITFSSNGTVNIGQAGNFGGYWANNLFRDFNESGDRAGIDFVGNFGDRPDPDQASAQIMHPWKFNSNSTTYNGSGPNLASGATSQSVWLFRSTLVSAPGRGGTFSKSINDRFASEFPTRPNVTSLRFEGGINVVVNNGSKPCSFTFLPAHSLLNPDSDQSQTVADLPVSVADRSAVLSLPDGGVTLSVPGAATIHWQALDPLTSYFSKDWIVDVYSNLASTVGNITMSNLNAGAGRSGISPAPYAYDLGVNRALIDQYGGFMNTIWWPAQRSGYAESGAPGGAASWAIAPTNSFRQEAAFPSVGFLQYLRTGVFPDGQLNEADRANWKGTPFRVLNYAEAGDTTQRSGVPDWALLDLFQIPVINPAGGTSGGSTIGRINPNSPTSLFPWTDVSRTAPLAAVFQGLRVNQTLDQTTGAFSGGTEIDAATAIDIAEGIGDYLTTLGRPFMMAAEIANVPEIQDVSRSIGPLNGSAVSVMNDLVRQAVGNLSTTTSVFSIWVVGQSVRKRPGNTNFGAFEAGDVVLAESRRRIVVERFLDLGLDGLPGNLNTPGPDNLVGTWDDPVDANLHPANPQYKYRIIHVEEI